jgi:hypothetical protein
MAELHTLSVEELYQLNMPYRTKLEAHQELTPGERAHHEAILEEVKARLTGLRKTELEERAKTHAPGEAPRVGNSFSKFYWGEK